MKKTLALICLLCLVGAFSVAQEYGNIRGKVMDKDGNALPGVTVTLTGSKIAPKSVVTSAEGNYRFLQLPNGLDYVLKFELQGFKSLSREKLDVSFGKGIELNITLDQATLEEQVTVIGQTPLVDTKKTTTGTNITATQMMSLPNARNPWVLMQMAPGMLLDREDVGGAEGGQQSQYLGHGANPWDSTWNIDGTNITDMGALGGTPAYLDMSGFEEIQINYGSNDITMPTAGVQLNYVTYRGGNKYSGMFYVDAEQKRWQADNRTAALKDAGYPVVGVNKVYLYGVNIGGPIIKDKLWFYGSYGIQDLGILNTIGVAVRTFLESGYGKLNAQLTKSTLINLQYSYNNKDREGREPWGGGLQATESTWHQMGPSPYYKAEVEQMFGNFYLSAKILRAYNSFYLYGPKGMPTSDMSGDYEVHRYYPSFFASGNINNDGTERPNTNASLNGNLFLENTLGGDHEFKFGLDMLHGALHSYSVQESNLDVELRSPTDVEVILYRNFEVKLNYDRISLYAQDTATYGRFTFRLGLRYDRESSKVAPFTQPASPWLPQYMGALSVPEIDPKFPFANISPRLGIIWDMFGTGKDLVKFSVARYHAQVGYEAASLFNPAPWTAIELRWVDANGDGRVTADELRGTDPGTGLPTLDPSNPAGWTYYSGFDVNDPTAVNVYNKFDPNYNVPITDEMLVSYEKELLTDLAIRVEGVARKRHNLVWDKGLYPDGSVETAANWYVAGTDPGTGAQYYGRYTRPPFTYRSNATKAYEQYYALQFVFTKKLSHRWMLDGSFTLDSWKYHYNGDYWDLTNKSYLDNSPLSSNASWVYSGTYVTANWMFKLAGLYQFPLGFNFSFNINGRQGYPYLPWNQVNKPNVGWSNVYAQDLSGNNIGKFGDRRLPDFFDANVRLEKVFPVGETMSAILGIDVFNAFNSSAAVSYQTSLQSPNFAKALKIINPRCIRIGARLTF
jgi:hypothetical protein